MSALVMFGWNIFLWVGFAYLVIVHGWSGWWAVLAFWMTLLPSERNS